MDSLGRSEPRHFMIICLQRYVDRYGAFGYPSQLLLDNSGELFWLTYMSLLMWCEIWWGPQCWTGDTLARHDSIVILPAVLNSKLSIHLRFHENNDDIPLYTSTHPHLLKIKHPLHNLSSHARTSQAATERVYHPHKLHKSSSKTKQEKAKWPSG